MHSRSASLSSPGAINSHSMNANGRIVWLRSNAATLCFGFETGAHSCAPLATCSHLRVSRSSLCTTLFEDAPLSWQSFDECLASEMPFSEDPVDSSNQSYETLPTSPRSPDQFLAMLRSALELGLIHPRNLPDLIIRSDSDRAVCRSVLGLRQARGLHRSGALRGAMIYSEERFETLSDRPTQSALATRPGRRMAINAEA